ncbi:hypothetical protein EBU60_01200 [bacterium]|nr:hypothetical protein [bacterium]
MLRNTALSALCMVALIACRPSIAPSSTPTPSYIAGSLVPSKPMAVGIHLPGTPGALAGGIVDIEAVGALTAGNITVGSQTFSGGELAFVGAETDNVVDLFVADAATALLANAAGADLVMVASLQRLPGWRLVTIASGSTSAVSDLAGGTVFVDGIPGDEVPLLLALKDAGIDAGEVTLVFPDDPGQPYDAASLLDGTIRAVLLRTFDGYARIAQYVDPATEMGIGEAALREIPLDYESAGSGLDVWATRTSIASDDQKIAVAATLLAWSQGSAKCREDVATCATQISDGSISDLSVETLQWTINQLNASIWPNPAGLFEIDATRLGVAISAANSVGIGSATTAESLIDRSILKLAQEQWVQGVDRNGAGWTPLDLPLP